MLVKHERRPFRFGVTLLAGLLGCLSLMGCKDEKTGAQAPTVPAVEVAVEIVTPQKVLYTTELAGRTSGFQIAEVRPQVSGIIQKRFFEEGAGMSSIRSIPPPIRPISTARRPISPAPKPTWLPRA